MGAYGHSANKYRRLLVVVFVLILIAGCGSGDENGATDSAVPAASNPRVVPTMPAARFEQPTPVTDMKEASEADKEADKSGPDLAAGEFVYGNRCAECHGEGATGTDKGSSLVGITLSEAEFEDLIRTGGDLGKEHLFGPTKISPDGLTAVYAYLTSLP